MASFYFDSDILESDLDLGGGGGGVNWTGPLEGESDKLS